MSEEYTYKAQLGKEKIGIVSRKTKEHLDEVVHRVNASLALLEKQHVILSKQKMALLVAVNATSDGVESEEKIQKLEKDLEVAKAETENLVERLRTYKTQVDQINQLEEERKTLLQEKEELVTQLKEQNLAYEKLESSCREEIQVLQGANKKLEQDLVDQSKVQKDMLKQFQGEKNRLEEEKERQIKAYKERLQAALEHQTYLEKTLAYCQDQLQEKTKEVESQKSLAPAHSEEKVQEESVQEDSSEENSSQTTAEQSHPRKRASLYCTSSETLLSQYASRNYDPFSREKGRLTKTPRH